MNARPNPRLKQVEIAPNPAGRVDILVERIADLCLKRFVDGHPLTLRLKQVGLDGPAMVRNEVRARLKREKITDVKSLRKALRR